MNGRKFLKLEKKVKHPYGESAEFISKGDFDEIKIGDAKIVDLYYRYQRREVMNAGEFRVKKIDEVSLEITPSEYTGNKYRLKTKVEYETIEETIEEGKTPSKEKIREWNMKIGEINSKLDEMILRISEYKKRDLKYAENNLFVNPKLTNIAFESLDRTSHEIAKLKVELEKLRYLYESER